MPDAVAVSDLAKTFSVKTKSPGLVGAVRALVRPEQRETLAVDRVSFRVGEGEALAFIGPNGAGKSTTIKMLTGILHPTSGEAAVLGRVPWRERERLAFDIGSVFGQKSQLWLHLPAADSFDLLARIYEVPAAEYRKRREHLVELFEIGPFFTTPVRKLSLGQRMRCEIAAALIHGPRLVFLDEPTIGLDIVARRTIRDLIRRLNREEGVTVFLTSHDVADVERVCRRVIVINHGRVIYDDSLGNLKRRYHRAKYLDLLLDTPASEFSCQGAKVVKAKGYGVKVEVDTDACRVDDVVARILGEYHVLDINIEDPPLEQVISEIYAAGGDAAGEGGAGATADRRAGPEGGPTDDP